MADDVILDGSKRQVVTEEEILAIRCPRCHVAPNVGCHNIERHPLSFIEGATELSFHRERIMVAHAVQLQRKFDRALTSTDKALIVYYAFVMLCDSVSTQSKSLLGSEFTSDQIQAFFAHKAIEQLKKDRLLG